MCSRAARMWLVVVPRRAAAALTGIPAVTMSWRTAARSMLAGSRPGRSSPEQQAAGGQPGTECFCCQLGFLRMSTAMATRPQVESGLLSADRDGYGLRPTAQN